ncbi:MAG: class I SAM-dependent RNA methyltransferase [Gemmatimonadaceae bacterium]
MTPTSAPFDCFAIVAPGLEPFALAEANALGLGAVLEEGGIAWTGDARSALVANAGLRIASRVLVRLASFEARSFAELERHARKVPWARVLKAGDAVRFRVTCKKSRLYHSDAVAQRVADAVMRVVPGARAHGGSVGDDDVVDDDASLVVVRVMRDRVTVSGDSSGALLHRRGYRQATAKAPLRETIAAAMISASGWDERSPLVDPLCGSGTIPIEAAMVARRLAPGAQRIFAMERWPTVPRSLGDEVRAELAERALARADVIIVGSDRDGGAITAATSNAERAGVASDVTWAERSLSAAQFSQSAKGWVVTNPPYGVRVGDADRVRDLWAQLGNVLRDRAAGWRVALLSPDAALDRQLRIPLRVAATTSNGGIPVRMMVGGVPE